MESSDLLARLANLSPAKRALLELRLRQKGIQSSARETMPRRMTRGFAPLSFAQQRLWFLDQFAPKSSLYMINTAMRLIGPLNMNALQKALDTIVTRHEVLRTTFVSKDGSPVQVIADRCAVKLPLVDLTENCDQEKERLIQEEAQHPFDLASDWMLRASIFRLKHDEHVLLLSMHHIVSDGWSMGVLSRELSDLYNAFSKGEPSPLSDLPVQYADYAIWQREWLQGEVLEGQLSYWKKQLENVSTLQLPTDRLRPAAQSYRGARQLLVLSRDLSERLKTCSRQEGVTLFMTLLASFQTLLHRYTGQDDVVVGSPIAGRTRPEIENLIGFFVNTLVLRTDFSGDLSFRKLLGRVREVALGAYAHQDLPFEKLVEELQPKRNLSNSPFFQVMFILQNAPKEATQLSDLTVSQVQLKNETAKFDLMLSVHDEAEGLRVSFDYSADLFDDATITRMMGHFRTLVEGIAADPNQRLSHLPLLTEAERHQLLAGWNDTKREYARDECIHELFEAQVEKTPDAMAVVFDDKQITYRELNQQANQLAHHLRNLGVGPETLVGICVDRSLAMIIGLLGILKAGGAYVPLDPEYPKDRLAFMLEDTQAPVLLTQQRLVENLPEHNAQVVCLDGDWEEINTESDENLYSGATANHLAYVIYTSGSTGKPKGVAIEHRSSVTLLSWVQSVFTADDLAGVLASTSICFDLSIFELFAPLTSGGKVILTENVLALPKLPAASQITLVNTVPSAIAELLRIKGIPSSVCTINLAGEPLTSSLVREIYQRTSATKVYDLYGPSEDTTYSTFALRTRTGPQTIGKPISSTQVYVLDQHMEPLPLGVPGELYIGGAGLARGYLFGAELTAAKFIPNPFSNEPGTRLYRTGDLGRYLPDGNIEFLGRIDHQVKIRGFRVELGEIEAVLDQHPAVRQAVVVVREDDYGDPSAPLKTGKRLVAYVAKDGPAPRSEEVRNFLKQKLPGYMVPSAIVFLDSLPLMPNGKVNRRALPAPDQSRPDLKENFVAPRGPVEEMLTQIWADVLKLEEVGIHDNFFDLGGHSLLAIQVISRIRRAFLVELPLAKLFESPTVAGLAEHLEEARRKEPVLRTLPILPVSRDKNLPLSFAQQRLWFLDQLEPGSPVYNVPGAVRLRGCLNVAALKQSLDEIVRRHEALRTTFSLVEGEPVQIIAPSLNIPLPIVDVSDGPESEREEKARHLGREEARRTFDLAREPLLRVTLLRLSEEDHVLLLTLHHIVSDGWSMGVLHRELSVLYEAFSKGLPSPLADLAIQYADFAQWQRGWLQGEVLETQVSYWKKALEDLPAILNLPTDRPRPALQSYRGARQSIELSQELTQRLKTLSRTESVTLFMTLLAAFQTLLHRYTGQDNIAVGSPIANRSSPEIESLIGFFVNTLVLRTELSGNPTFRELLARVREVALGAFAHHDLPFEKLVEELQPDRNLSSSPLCQVMFVLQNAPFTALEFEGLSVTPVRLDNVTAKFDLTLSIHEEAEGLRASFEYNTDLFDGATIDRMIRYFQTMIEAIVANPDQRISDLPILREAERHQLVVEWNDTGRDYPRDKCIQELFEAQVEKAPQAVAVVFKDERLTYQKLNQRANRLAHYLRKRGVGPDVLVGICMERSLEMIVGLLGILKAGGAYVPLDPEYPKERLAFMLKDAQAEVLVTEERLMEKVVEDRRSRPALSEIEGIENRYPLSSILDSRTRVVCLDRDWEEIARESEENPGNKVTAENLAYVIYTSGSTGKPKGVEVPHRGITRLLFGVDYAQLDASQTILHLAPTSFDASTFEIWGALLHGAKCVFYPGAVPSPKELGEMLSKHNVSTLWLTASLFNIMIDEAAEILSGVRQLLIGGEALSVSHVRRAVALLPQTKIINGYGPTESTTFACCYSIPGGADGSLQSIPIGRPIANTQIYLLDSRLQPVPVGVRGDLYIGGDGLARGYLNRPELTAEKFIPHPFTREPGARLYKTGDRARYLPDRNIEFVGRIDDQVKIRGFRIELGEIEAVLVQHPAVKESAVLVQESIDGDPSAEFTLSAEGVRTDPSTSLRIDKRLVAYVVAGQDSATSAYELRNFLKQKLPDYMMPSGFVFLNSLPLTPNGKVDRRALPGPDSSCVNAQMSYVAPRTETEKTLSVIWAKVLGIERVGIHDNFFDLGGHSLLAVRLCAQIEKVSGKNLPVASLFRAPTVEQLARFLHQKGWSSASSSVIPIHTAGSKPPFFCVHGVWGSVLFCADLARRLGPDQPFYGLQAPGFDGERAPLTQVEAMAAHYIHDIREVQSEGPYLLGGLSMGGLVAFEMAQQLRAQGQNVALLVLIDTQRPIRTSFLRVWFNRFQRAFVTLFVGRFVYHGLNLLQLSPSEQWSYIREKARILGARISKRRIGDRSIEAADLRYIYPVKIREANIQAMRSYEPQSYPGRITLFRVSDTLGRFSTERRTGWRELAGGGLEVCEVPGNHSTMIREPHIRVLVEKLRHCLQGAQTIQATRMAQEAVCKSQEGKFDGVD